MLVLVLMQFIVLLVVFVVSGLRRFLGKRGRGRARWAVLHEAFLISTHYPLYRCRCRP